MISSLQSRLLDRSNPAKIHLIGVAGSGMSGLALMLMEMGHIISGSDRVSSKETERLQSLGLSFSSPQTAESIKDSEIIIYSSAIRPDNPALFAARQLGLPCLRRADCLAAILNNKQGVVISGTHGKTTTSSLCAHILREARQRPCHYVGAEIPILGANAHWNESSPWLIAEGDESDGTLVNYKPVHSIVLNIEAEHLDHYKDLDEIKQVFSKLLDQSSGKVIYCAADPGANSVAKDRPNAISYGWNNADFTPADLQELKGRTVFTLVHKNIPIGRIELGIPGRHNVLNALAAIALAFEIGIPFEAISHALASFAGARRRFETCYFSPNFRVVDDYGHHPTEIAATLQTARSLHPKRLIVIFQPHRFSRTQKLAADFGVALQNADQVFVTNIYPASELPIEGISGQTIVDAIHQQGPTPASFHPTFDEARLAAGNILKPGDLILTLGAGNVHEIGTILARDLAVVDDFLRISPIPITLYEPLSRHTTLKIGGPAQFWIKPETFKETQQIVNFCRERGIPISLIGRGSNLLIRDGGIRGAVLHPSIGEFGEISVHGNIITAGAGVKCKKLAASAQSANLGGLEWLDGIPGNIGGAIRMNAGAMNSEIFDSIIDVTTLDEDGEIHRYEKEEIQAQYRNVPFLQNRIILQANFNATPSTQEKIVEALENSRNKRKLSQPIMASAGCTFKNPENISAGKLIDELGLKNHQIGDAKVSEIHANFIVNIGNATARNMLDLIDEIQAKAKKERQINLQTEVQIIGQRELSF